MRILLSVVAAVALTAGAVTPASAAGRGVFETYRPGANAVTYDPAKVPVGARAAVAPFVAGRNTVVILLVHGLLPNRHYGAHVHVKPCGALPADAGPHFQNVADPVQPSVDPAYANPRNEVWIDFATDAKGAAISVTKVPWRFGKRPAASVIIHNEHTHTGPGEAGTAGPRLACLNSTF
ncbi:superoxide dismutase [Actinokineospora sp. NBRC 105648]|uniref:superoxide dismutase n=1 Tax=Actinokineospora sp. NBRC 105648 TaxID=3032206 RepID=UPI0024A5478A|nr:superoxide dismutase [Actinokineospora sp. NBRC 105648]GLZ39537.1 hypothetical protein Acsp05_31610 [Actinokineospora sp. NBRC 105648]